MAKLINDRESCKEINRYCDKLNIACIIAGNTVEVYKDVINGEHISIEFESVKQVISEINAYFGIKESVRKLHKEGKDKVVEVSQKEFLNYLKNKKNFDDYDYYNPLVKIYGDNINNEDRVFVCDNIKTTINNKYDGKFTKEVDKFIDSFAKLIDYNYKYYPTYFFENTNKKSIKEKIEDLGDNWRVFIDKVGSKKQYAINMYGVGKWDTKLFEGLFLMNSKGTSLIETQIIFGHDSALEREKECRDALSEIIDTYNKDIEKWYNSWHKWVDGEEVRKPSIDNYLYPNVTKEHIMRFCYIVADVLDKYNKPLLRESKKSVRKSIKEGKSLVDYSNVWTIIDVNGKFKGRDYCYVGNDYSLFNIGNIIENALRDDYILDFDCDIHNKSIIFILIDKNKKEVGTLELIPEENGYYVDEMVDKFYDFLKAKIEYLKSDRRFDYSDRFWFNESKKYNETMRKSIKESVKPDIQLMVNRIIDNLIGEYSNMEWRNLSDNEKFDIIRAEYFMFDGKPKYLSEVRDLVMENMNHPFDVKFESKKFVHKSIKEKSIYDKEFSIAVSNALKYGEEWNIPFKYSDDDDFTKGLEKYLEDKDYVFSGSFVTKEYGLVHEYKDKGLDETDFWTVYLVIDKSFKSSGICVGILGDLN